jgi:hypothetical protein
MRAVEVRARIREESPGRWTAETDSEPELRIRGSSLDRCIASLTRAVRRAGQGSSKAVTLVVELVPQLAGVAEAARIMGWDKRRVITYIDRGHFPQPIQGLASGRVWLRSDVERFAQEWRARRARRGPNRPPPEG